MYRYWYAFPARNHVHILICIPLGHREAWLSAQLSVWQKVALAVHLHEYVWCMCDVCVRLWWHWQYTCMNMCDVCVVCVCGFLSVSRYASTHTYKCVCMYGIYIYMHTYTRYMYIYVHAHLKQHTSRNRTCSVPLALYISQPHTYKYVYLITYIQIYTCMYIHVYAHRHAETYPGQSHVQRPACLVYQGTATHSSLPLCSKFDHLFSCSTY